MTDLATVCAVGAGRMGQGIAHAFAFAGHPVQLVDLKPRSEADARAVGERAFAEIRSNLTAMADLGVFEHAAIDAVLARIRFVPADRAADELAAADFIFEGVPETLQAKQSAFAALAPLVRDDAIIASTTSTMLSTDLAQYVSGAERFLNAHWLNPAFLIPLVELSPHAGSDEAAVERLRALLERIGKVPVRCAAEPGYIVPRLQTLIMNEAARMIEDGVATAEDIDRATRFGFGTRYAGMGVVEFIDFGGNDILYHASNYLSEALETDRYRAPDIIAKYMQEGRNGLRDGVGFYDWRDRDLPAYRREALKRLADLIRLQGLLPKPG